MEQAANRPKSRKRKNAIDVVDELGLLLGMKRRDVYDFVHPPVKTEIQSDLERTRRFNNWTRRLKHPPVDVPKELAEVVSKLKTRPVGGSLIQNAFGYSLLDHCRGHLPGIHICGDVDLTWLFSTRL